MKLKSHWNLDFSKRPIRRDNLRRHIRANLRCEPKGRGNKAWKRFEAMTRNDFHLIGGIYLVG